jgi:endonuclease-3
VRAPACRIESSRARGPRSPTRRVSERTFALDFTNAYQLLAATILSAQCTDKRVNMVHADALRALPDAEALAAAKQEDVEEIIKTNRFFRKQGEEPSEWQRRSLSTTAAKSPPTWTHS